MKIENKNLLDVENGVIFHQVNTLGIMGGGLAAQIRNRFPESYEEYKNFIKFKKESYEKKYGTFHHSLLLGSTISSFIEDQNLNIVHVFGQSEIGQGRRQTCYAALERAFTHLNALDMSPANLYFPFGFGCGLAGSDWDIVSKLIEFHFPTATICKLE
jgi:O-acetyl-ADP-ribose deacetylase (regulator of RNase III)